jgi:hypothetical protein
MIYFDQISGMKINYSKSDIVPVNLDEEETLKYSKIFYCKVGSFPFKYVRVPSTMKNLEERKSNMLWTK